MTRHRSAPEILRSVPPHDRAFLLRLGVDLDDPADAEVFIEGVRAADRAIAEQARWERERLGGDRAFRPAARISHARLKSRSLATWPMLRSPA